MGVVFWEKGVVEVQKVVATELIKPSIVNTDQMLSVYWWDKLMGWSCILGKGIGKGWGWHNNACYRCQMCP
jgi:hypothetical protein